jgi:hypothetical protein
VIGYGGGFFEGAAILQVRRDPAAFGFEGNCVGSEAGGVIRSCTSKKSGGLHNLTSGGILEIKLAASRVRSPQGQSSSVEEKEIGSLTQIGLSCAQYERRKKFKGVES